MVASANIADSGRQWEDSTSYDIYDYVSELLYFVLVMVLPGTFQFDINFALTGQ